MSFTFEWPRFGHEFHEDAKSLLDAALNKGNKPPIIADRIEVVELEMGTQPPELEVRDIGELTTEQFRGIFRLTYSGDAHIVLRTKVQANPLNHKPQDIHAITSSLGILAAHQPLVVPMLLRLSHFRLSAYVVLVVSRQKGITLVFKTDPLQNVDVNSTFDSIAVIQSYIQKEIEGQLRNMFREDLPSIIHRLSQRWLAAQTKVPVTIDTSYPVNLSSTIPVTKEALEALGSIRETGPSTASFAGSSQFRSRPSIPSRTSKVVRKKTNRGDLEQTAFPDIEHFDPTYGLRPEGIPVKASYGGYGSLFVPDPGLGGLAEEGVSSGSDDELDLGAEAASFDGKRLNPLFTNILSDQHSSPPEFETIPAVGGGTITRPRIYHAQSFTQHHGSRPAPPSASIFSAPPTSQVRPPPIGTNQNVIHPIAGAATLNSHLHSPEPNFNREASEDSQSSRRRPEPVETNIVLRPALNNNVSHLSMLSNSYHTLSPYTRSMDHYIMRSGPPKDPHPATTERQAQKARRRRIYRFRSPSMLVEQSTGMHEQIVEPTNIRPPLSDYEEADIEHYFKVP